MSILFKLFDLFKKKQHILTIVDFITCKDNEQEVHTVKYMLSTRGSFRVCEFCSSSVTMKEEEHKFYSLYIDPWLKGDDTAIDRYCEDTRTTIASIRNIRVAMPGLKIIPFPEDEDE